ncbi:MAG: hypothetical protein ACI4D7_14280 [Lachnospiraceae bacterium]
MVFARKDLFTLNYYKKQPYTASSNGTRIRLKKESDEAGDYLELITWPEPFCFEKTPDEQKNAYRFEYSEEGICAVIEWLNENLN